MKAYDVLSHLAKVFLIVVVILLALELGAHWKKAYYKTIQPNLIDSDDWAESAHALGVHPDSLSLELFLEHNSIQTRAELRQFMKSIQ